MLVHNPTCRLTVHEYEIIWIFYLFNGTTHAQARIDCCLHPPPARGEALSVLCRQAACPIGFALEHQIHIRTVMWMTDRAEASAATKPKQRLNYIPQARDRALVTIVNPYYCCDCPAGAPAPKRTVLYARSKAPYRRGCDVGPIRYIIKLIGFCSLMLPVPILAGGKTAVPMHDKGAATYYVPVSIKGWGTGDFLVDTGASYMAINQTALDSLKASDQAEYIKQLVGTLADGGQIIVPIYRISSVIIGDNCILTNVEAAVFPGNTRNILGLSALRRAAPFQFSVNPPTLKLSGCKADARTAGLN